MGKPPSAPYEVSHSSCSFSTRRRNTTSFNAHVPIMTPRVVISAEKNNNVMVNQKRLDETYLAMAHIWGRLSHAKRKQVGCLIVRDNQIISDGFNGTPTGFSNACEGEDGETLKEVLHAETNALTKLARGSQQSIDSTLYTTLSPCFDCAKMIFQSGIIRVVCGEAYSDTSGISFLRELGVEVVVARKKLNES